MCDDVKICAEARLNMFTQYYIVPEAVRPDVEAFQQRLLNLAEESADSAAFEAGFAEAGLNEQFSALLVRCTPKPYQMTQQEKATVAEVKRQMREEKPGELGAYIAKDVADSVMMKAESDMIAATRKAMIASGTYDEYTRMSNAMEDVGIVAKGLGRLFKKRK